MWNEAENKDAKPSNNKGREPPQDIISLRLVKHYIRINHN